MRSPFQRAVAWVAQATGAVPNLDDPRWWGVPSMGSVAGVNVTPTDALQLGVVQSVLQRLGGTLSSLPLMVYERTGAGGQGRRPATDHPLYRLLRTRPNRSQTAQEFRDELTKHLAWWRNAYAIIRPDADGFPIGELDQVHPSRVLDVFRGPDGRRYYKIRRLGQTSEFDVFSEDEVWHTRMAPLTTDGLRGQPVWETARETLGRALAVEQFGARFFANSSHAGGVITVPGTFKDKEAEQAFLATWREGGSGANQHRDRMLKNGASYTPPGLTNEDSQFLETKKETKYELASLWNMPGHMVGLLDRATFSNIEQQSIEYVVHTISPFVTAIEQSAERDLLIGDDQASYFVEFDLSGLLRGDLKTRWGAWFQGRQGGWLSINDVRRLENMDPIGPDGDIYETALNMKPAGAPNPADPQGSPSDPEDKNAP